MRLATATYAPYRLPLRTPLQIGAATLTERAGLVVALRDSQGHVGFGEAAPLPGLHGETLAQVEVGLEQFCAKAPGARFDELEALSTAASEWEGEPMGSFVFALEMAWLGLEAVRRCTVPARVLASHVHSHVPVNHWLASADAPLPPLPSRAVLKVKVGRQAVSAEAQALTALVRRLPADARLRLDANRSLSLEQATELLGALPEERVEYIEEPLRDPSLLGELHHNTGHRIALDETLLEPERHALLTSAGVVAWVLKPSRLGGVLATLAWIRTAQRALRRAVLSSTFESSLGLELLAQLAALANETPVAAGLGTAGVFAEDLLEPPLSGEQIDPLAWRGQPSPPWLQRLGLGPVLAR